MNRFNFLLQYNFYLDVTIAVILDTLGTIILVQRKEECVISVRKSAILQSAAHKALKESGLTKISSSTARKYDL